MAFENIQCHRHPDSHVAVLTIHRPKVLNALDPATVDEVMAATATFASDVDARVLIITGAGDKAFVAGADIGAMAEMSVDEAEAFARRGQAMTKALEDVAKPVIAAVNGFALGGGCELAMACDFILASDRARFGQPEVALGLIPGFGGTQRLARLVGRAMARRLCFTGEQVSAQRAYELGLVQEVVSHEELMPTAMHLAELIVSRGPLAVGACKRAINRGADLSLEAGLDVEVMLFAGLFHTGDVREGTAAFLERRTPQFTRS